METPVTAPGAWFKKRGRVPIPKRLTGRDVDYRGRRRLMRWVLQLQDARDQLDSEIRDAWLACEAAGIGPLELYGYAERLDSAASEVAP